MVSSVERFHCIQDSQLGPSGVLFNKQVQCTLLASISSMQRRIQLCLPFYSSSIPSLVLLLRGYTQTYLGIILSMNESHELTHTVPYNKWRGRHKPLCVCVCVCACACACVCVLYNGV